MGIDFILKLLLSAMLGGIIGLDREISHKDSGLRISVMIAVGSTLLSVLAVEFSSGAVAVKSNLLGSPFIISIFAAVGIIGAAVIIKKQFTFDGMSTASSIWCTGALGIAVGTGYYLMAFVSSLFIMGWIFLLKSISNVIENYSGKCVYMIHTEESASVSMEIKKIMMDLGLKYIRPNIRRTEDGYLIEMVLHTSEYKNKSFVERVLQIPDVKEISIES